MKDKITRTVAIYQTSGEYESTSVLSCPSWADRDADYIRITEPLEVTFTPLPDDVILDGRVKSIDAEIEKTRAELTLRVNDLLDQKQRLLCITQEVSDE